MTDIRLLRAIVRIQTPLDPEAVDSILSYLEARLHVDELIAIFEESSSYGKMYLAPLLAVQVAGDETPRQSRVERLFELATQSDNPSLVAVVEDMMRYYRL